MNAVLSIVYSDVPGFPAGSAVSDIRAVITDSSGVAVTQDVSPGAASVTFTSVAPGDYTFSVGALDTSGNPLGTAVTGKFSITAPSSVTLSLPTSVTAAQS